MTRVRLYLVGSVVLLALAGCGRSWLQFAERPPWRRDAEVACLKSGAVKEGPGLVRIDPIEGPGICGADFPLKVAELGTGIALGFAGEPRPPGSIPGAYPAAAPQRWPVTPVRRFEPPPLAAAAMAAPGMPLSIYAPGIAAPAGTPAEDEDELDRGEPPRLAPPQVLHAPGGPFQRPGPPLGPPRGQQLTGAIGPVAVTPAATLACPIVSALDQWIAATVQPTAMRWFGQPVVAIKQISAYSCRGMNGNPRAHISEHAFGNALDVAGFTFADGRKLLVRTGWHGSPAEQGFLHDVQGGACSEFTTVLAPGYNVYHYDHIHVDLMRRSRGRHVCRPAAIPGEVAAARAAKRGSYARRGDPTVTGSIGTLLDKLSKGRAEPEEDAGAWVEDEETPEARVSGGARGSRDLGGSFGPESN